MSENAALVFVIIAFMLGTLGGCNLERALNRDQALKNEAGYFHPKTGVFVFNCKDTIFDELD